MLKNGKGKQLILSKNEEMYEKIKNCTEKNLKFKKREESYLLHYKAKFVIGTSWNLQNNVLNRNFIPISDAEAGNHELGTLAKSTKRCSSASCSQ